MADPGSDERTLQRIRTLAVAISVRALPRIVGSLLDANLTIKQLRVLSSLTGPVAVTLTRLAEDFDVSLATMSGIVDKLVQRDLVGRVADPDDRRARRLELTPLGRAVVGEILTPRPHLGVEVLAGLDTDELVALEIGLGAINRELSEDAWERRG